MITEGIFKANDIRGVTEGPEPEWDEAGATAVGVALVAVLGLGAGDQLVLGRDMRVSGERMSAAFTEGVLSRGVDVLDIDNTALETDFGFSFPQPANEPVLEVARYAEERGVDLFFVTARPGIIYAPTEWNLDRAGYESSGLYVRGFIDLFRNVAEYKTAQRIDIERKGYTIIANIGNSATDLSGGHAERTFKLPDYDGQLS